MPESAGLWIEVAYASPQRIVTRTYRLAAPATVADALRAAAADAGFLGIDLSALAVGVYGQRAAPDRVLEEGDRVEIYRPLVNDPKLARRSRVERARRQRGAGR